MWKIGRRLYYGARRDGSLVMGSNGEGLLQQAFARRSAASGKPLVIADVGANLGDWTATMIEALDEAGAPGARIIPFEPVPVIREKLRKRFEKPTRHAVEICSQAVSEHAGRQEFVCHGDEAGSHHLATDFMERSGTRTEVEVVRLDDRFADVELDLVKIDAEGFDPLVIRGAESMLADKRIGAIQFEYSVLFIRSRTYLYDMFEIAEKHGYRVGLLTGEGIEIFDEWHQDLEQFIACNMVMCRPDALAWLPARRAVYGIDNTRETMAIS